MPYCCSVALRLFCVAVNFALTLRPHRFLVLWICTTQKQRIFAPPLCWQGSAEWTRCRYKFPRNRASCPRAKQPCDGMQHIMQNKVGLSRVHQAVVGWCFRESNSRLHASCTMESTCTICRQRAPFFIPGWRPLLCWVKPGNPCLGAHQHPLLC